MYGQLVLQDAVVPKMRLCVTFGASAIGANFRKVCALSEYDMFCAISATAVREMTMCVTFGAHRLHSLATAWRRPAVHDSCNFRHGSGFGAFGIACSWPAACVACLGRASFMFF